MPYYNKDEISELTLRYLKTKSSSDLEQLLSSIEGIINLQLYKKYYSMEEFWDDMTQEVLIILWKNLLKNPEQLRNSEVPTQWFWERIRSILYANMKKLKTSGKGYDSLNKNIDSFDDEKYEKEEGGLDKALFNSENVFDATPYEEED